MKYIAPVAEKLAVESINVLLSSSSWTPCVGDSSLPIQPCEPVEID